MSSVAIIPARGGSKRIPRKNIKDFCGKPIIAWSIEAALKSGCFDKVIVSTDDQEIADISRQHGAEVPFIRPEKLSDDYAGTLPVICHALEWLLNDGIKVDRVCCIYATAPFLRPSDLRSGFEYLVQDESLDFIFSATKYSFPIQRALKINSMGRVEMFQPEHFETRSQDLEEAYHDAGQFYWGTSQAWIEQKAIFSSNSAAHLLPTERVQDIDTPEDWERAEVMYQVMKTQGAV